MSAQEYPGADGDPRYLSPPHPQAAGSLADEWIAWIESEVGHAMQLRPWQRTVLQRVWEVDAAGQLCWRSAVVSTGRQFGKSYLARAGIAARCEFAARFGEPQECLHVANALVAARRIQSRAWRWAELRGLEVRRGQGNERIEWPDESMWQIVATKSVYGSSGSLVFVDEGWDLTEETIENGVVPTMLERAQPQLWLVSTAHPEATSLIPGYRREALAGSDRVMIAEWSTPPDADLDDERVWRRFSPHWSQQRLEAMRDARDRPGFAHQYLNMWPEVTLAGEREWPQGWAGCGRVDQALPAGGVGVIESTVNRAFYGCAYAVGGERGVRVVTARFSSLEEAAGWVNAQRPGRVVVGLSLVKVLPLMAATVEGYGSSHTVVATPALEDLVRRGLVAHDHGEDVAAQTRHATVVQSERGMFLSGKKSKGAVDVLKAVAWGAWACTLPAAEDPAIW